ncbi:MAG TPA: zinc ribbon domain-containing protein [Longimicrobiales bacterium]
MKCPNCQTDSPGAYCPTCGAPLDGARCKACEAPLLPGARFCVQCGEPVRRESSRASWYVAAAAVLGLVVLGTVVAFRGERGVPAAAGAAMAQGPTPGSPGRAPPLTGTPREQADRLFNRVMQAMAQGDTAQASFFLPMAILAYRQAGELDADGLYHLAVLEAAAGNYRGSLETAERILAEQPDHLLGLGAAARAAVLAGDSAVARRHYERLLRAFDAERAREPKEYRDHARILPEYRDEAAAFTGAR